MAKQFTKVVMRPGQSDIARVNRETGVLYLNPKIWDELPSNEKEFVLFHEAGHLKYATPSEFKANKYAIKKFIPVKTITKRELGKKIMVMRSILDKADDNHPESGFGLGDAIASAVGGVTQALPLLGVGSKARINETNANIDANLKMFAAQNAADNAKNKTLTRTMIIAAVLFLVMGTVFLTLYKNEK